MFAYNETYVIGKYDDSCFYPVLFQTNFTNAALAPVILFPWASSFLPPHTRTMKLGMVGIGFEDSGR